MAPRGRPCGVLAASAGWRIAVSVTVWVFVWWAPANAGNRLRLHASDLGAAPPGRTRVIPFELFEPARQVELLVETVAGKVVERRVAVGQRPGVHGFEWDGLGPDGKPLPDGGYRLVIRAVFEDGGVEAATLTARLVAPPDEALRGLPEPPPPRTSAHRIHGRWLNVWQRDRGERSDGEATESRFTLGLGWTDPDRRVEGIFDYRSLSPGEADFAGSALSAQRRIEGGLLTAVFRRSLSSFDDPLSLFNDFRTEYRKAGVGAERALGRFRMQGLGFVSEGDTATAEKGGGARLTAATLPWLDLGATATARWFDTDEGDGDAEWVGAVDGCLKPWSRGEAALFSELALSRSDADDDGTAFTVGSRFGLGPWGRGSMAFIHLDQRFSASFSNPLRGVRRDGTGLAFGADVVTPGPGVWGRGGPMAFSWAGYCLRRHSHDDLLAELDAAARWEVGPATSIALSWIGTQEGDDAFSAIQASADRRWTPTLGSRIEGTTTTGSADRAARIRAEADAVNPWGGVRWGAEWVGSDAGGYPGTVAREFALFGDLWGRAWRLEASLRWNRRDGADGLNGFARLERRFEWLRRYRLTGYLALGDRAAFETADSVEAGLEVTF